MYPPVHQIKINTLSVIHPRMNNTSTYTLMPLSSLAQPDWISVSCHKWLLESTVCIKTHDRKNVTDMNMESTKNGTIFQNSHLRVEQKCFVFLLATQNKHFSDCKTFNLEGVESRFASVFQNLFESVKPTNQFPLLFFDKEYRITEGLRYNSVIRTFKHCHTHASLENGYHVCRSKFSDIIFGINLFNCTKTGYILYQYVCDGNVDCPNDNSNEEFCKCYSNTTDAGKSFHCKYIDSCMPFVDKDNNMVCCHNTNNNFIFNNDFAHAASIEFTKIQEGYSKI